MRENAVNKLQQAEILIDDFQKTIAHWLSEFEDLQPWEQDGDISDIKWSQFRYAVQTLLAKYDKLNEREGGKQ